MGLKGSLPDWFTLGDAKAWLRVRWKDGTTCPCCGQKVMLYPRQVTGHMVQALAVLHANTMPGEFSHWPTLLVKYRISNAGDGMPMKLRYWDLVEEDSQVRPDGGRAGYWRLTDRGRLFLRGVVSIQQYAMVYNRQCYGFEGPAVWVSDRKYKKFDLRELLNGS
jgi:hypothetical protein